MSALPIGLAIVLWELEGQRGGLSTIPWLLPVAGILEFDGQISFFGETARMDPHRRDLWAVAHGREWPGSVGREGGLGAVT